MHSYLSGDKLTLGQLLAHLRRTYQPDASALAEALQTSYTTYLNTERGNRELSFLMALRICQFYKMDIHDFIAMLSDEELKRTDRSVSRAKEQREKKKTAVPEEKNSDVKTIV